MKNSEKFNLREFLKNNKIESGKFKEKEFQVKTKNSYNDVNTKKEK